MTDISKFFTALSERAYKENDLSDVTYAMCEADPVFKQFFLDFFFRDQELNAEDCTIDREVAYQDGARPDIVVREKNGRAYFVEVKIWDGNHHFAQYASTLEKIEHVEKNSVCDHFGYIANYKVAVSENAGNDYVVCRGMREKGRVKTWSGFCATLEKYGCFADDSVKAYVSYCLKVLGNDDLYKRLKDKYKMDALSISEILNGLEEVKSFDAGLLTAMEELDGISVYNQAKYFNPTYWMGHHFSFSSIEGKTADVWAWIGVWLRPWNTRNGGGCRPCIILRDQQGWGKIACDKFRTAGIKVYEEGGKIFLGLKNGFSPKVTIEAFVLWVRGIQNQFLDLLGDEQQSIDCAKVFYIVPMFIRNELTGSVRTDKCEYKVEYVYGNDAQQPQSWCGEYLEISRAVSQLEASSPDGENHLGVNESKKTCYVGCGFANEKEKGLFLEVDGKRRKLKCNNLGGIERLV